MSTQIENSVQKLLYSINDAAKALSMSRSSIYREINAGALPFVQHGGRKYISRRVLETWIRDREFATKMLGPEEMKLTSSKEVADLQLTKIRKEAWGDCA